MSHDVAHVDLHVEPREVDGEEHEGLPGAGHVDAGLQRAAVALQVGRRVLAAAAAARVAARGRLSAVPWGRLGRALLLLLLGCSTTLKGNRCFWINVVSKKKK